MDLFNLYLNLDTLTIELQGSNIQVVIYALGVKYAFIKRRQYQTAATHAMLSSVHTAA